MYAMWFHNILVSWVFHSICFFSVTEPTAPMGLKVGWESQMACTWWKWDLFLPPRLESHTLDGSEGKAIPFQAQRVLRVWGYQFSRQSEHEGGNTMHKPPLPPQEIFLVLVSVRGRVDPRDIARLEGLCWEMPMTPSGIAPHNLPAYSAVPQPTTPPRAALVGSITSNMNFFF